MHFCSLWLESYLYPWWRECSCEIFLDSSLFESLKQCFIVCSLGSKDIGYWFNWGCIATTDFSLRQLHNISWHISLLASPHLQQCVCWICWWKHVKKSCCWQVSSQDTRWNLSNVLSLVVIIWRRLFKSLFLPFSPPYWIHQDEKYALCGVWVREREFKLCFKSGFVGL